MRRLALLWLLLAAPSVSAQPARLPALHWTRAEDAQGCIDPRSLARQVEALTGRVLVPASEAELSIEGAIVRRKGGYRARIVATRADRAPRGERVLEQSGDDCRALDGALVLVIALFIDPELALRGLPPELLGLLPASERAPEQVLLEELTRSTPRPPAAPARADVTRAPERAAAPAESGPPALQPRWAFALGAQVAGKSLPGVAVGVAAAGGYRLTPHMAVLLWTQLGKSVHEVDVAAQRGMSAFSLSGAPLFCPWFAWSERWSSGACLGPELGWLRAVPSGFARGRDADLSYFTAMLRLSAGYRVTRELGISVAGLLRANLVQRSVVYDDVEQRPEVYRLPPVGAAAELGVSYAF